MTGCRRQRLALRAACGLLVGVAAVALTGCGQKGPLVLPDGMSGDGGQTAPAASGATDEDDDERAADGDGTEDRADGR